MYTHAKKRILAVETSCDETALALVEARGGLSHPRFKIVKNLIASQVKVHAPFGGVVPNLAKREHMKRLPILLKRVARDTRGGVDVIAVTVGPGLEPALWTGITFAKALAKKMKKPLVGVNHLEGHLYSVLLPHKGRHNIPDPKRIFPAIALIVSGGHTLLLLVHSLTRWKTLGETRDDAVGEAFDKVARLLRLPYPGGPEVETLARHGNPKAINFPQPMVHNASYDFSFSGLKTSVLYYLRDHKKFSPPDVAASFQEAALAVLVAKTLRAVKEFKVRSVILSGGVAANALLRKKLEKESKVLNVNFFVPDFKYNTDNATMIAAAGYFTLLRKKRYKLAAQGNLTM